MMNFPPHILLLCPQLKFAVFCVKSSKGLGLHHLRAELDEHFNGSLYFSRCLSKQGFHFYQLCFDMDAYFSENRIYKNVCENKFYCEPYNVPQKQWCTLLHRRHKCHMLELLSKTSERFVCLSHSNSCSGPPQYWILPILFLIRKKLMQRSILPNILGIFIDYKNST
jgi:hypothetical protein